MNILKKSNWNKSYANKDNFVFYPREDIIRFISKYVRKKTGIDSFINIDESDPKILDFGCGIGRHVKFLDEYKLDAYGFDLSEVAISTAHEHFKRLSLDHLINQVIVADITNLPYESEFFNYMLSHGVLDSMSYEIAKKGIAELHRVMDSSGVIFFDLISSSDRTFKNGQDMDQKQENAREHGTIQSYYDLKRIDDLVKDKFDIIELIEASKIDHINKHISNRFNVIARKI